MTEAAEITPRDKLAAAMAALGLTIAAEFVPFSQSRSKAEEWQSLNWRITLQRNGRDVLSSDYGAGTGHCPAHKRAKRDKTRYMESLRKRAIAAECETGRAHDFGEGMLFGRDGIRDLRIPIMPDSVDVMWSLSQDSSVLDSGGFENWASELGYDSDSRTAESIYQHCLEIALKLRGAIGESGLESLRIAGEDF